MPYSWEDDFENSPERRPVLWLYSLFQSPTVQVLRGVQGVEHEGSKKTFLFDVAEPRRFYKPCGNYFTAEHGERGLGGPTYLEPAEAGSRRQRSRTARDYNSATAPVVRYLFLLRRRCRLSR